MFMRRRSVTTATILLLGIYIMCQLALRYYAAGSSELVKRHNAPRNDRVIDKATAHAELARQQYAANETLRHRYMQSSTRDMTRTLTGDSNTNDTHRIHIAVTSYAQVTQQDDVQHLIQARTLLKSALLNNPTSLHFHIFAEDYYRFYLGQFLYQSRQLRRFDFMYTFYNFTYAATSDVTTTNNTRAGSTLELRALEVLYLPATLPGIERVLYLDSGSLVLGPLQEMWAVFDTLDPVQSVSMAYNPWLVDDHTPKRSVPRSLTTEATPSLDYSTDVMLMDLQKLRQHSSWQQEVKNYVADSHARNRAITPEIVLNTMRKNHCDLFHTMPCSYNYHQNFCASAETTVSSRDAPQRCDGAGHGALILRGTGTIFQADDSLMKYVFDAYEVLNIAVHDVQYLKDLIRETTLPRYNVNCYDVREIFYKRLDAE